VAEEHPLKRLYPPPPWRWQERRALWQFWVRDVIAGVSDFAVYYPLRLLPTDLVSRLGVGLGQRAGKRRPAAMQRARALLRFLRPEASAAEIEAALVVHWAHVGRCFAEFSAQYRFLREGRIEIAGQDVLDRIRAEGRPLIVAGTHVGSWETIHMALSSLEIPFHATFQRLPNRFRMRIAYDMRHHGRRFAGAQVSGQLLPTFDAAFQAHRMLETREAALLFYIDEMTGERLHAPAFGRSLRIDGNIARVVRLAAHTGAAVVPVTALRTADAARFRVTFLPEVKMGPPGRGRAGILEDIAALDAVLEREVRAHPEQWLGLHIFRPDGQGGVPANRVG
jgi:Kdo2-lipid IVA lauroyltransferase/acyltransferase